MSYLDSGGIDLIPRPSSDSYFDINDILSSQSKIPSKFETTVYNLGFLDPASESENIEVGTKCEIPFWLAKELCNRRRRVVSVEVPKGYRESYRQILQADANVVDLHRLGPYFYDFGTKLLSFDYDEAPQIANSIQEAFVKRFRRIMDSSQHCFHEDTSTLTLKLDEIEREIFHSGLKGTQQFQLWESGKGSKLTTSETVINHRKRKRVAMET